MATTFYSRDGCPHCDALRARLDTLGRRYAEINLSTNPEALPELVKLTRGRRVVPVLVDGIKIEIAPEGGSEF